MIQFKMYNQTDTFTQTNYNISSQNQYNLIQSNVVDQHYIIGRYIHIMLDIKYNTV